MAASHCVPHVHEVPSHPSYSSHDSRLAVAVLLNLKNCLAAILHASGINAQFAAVTNCPKQGDNMVEKTQASPREATAVFSAEDELRDVINELESAGFDHAEISVLPPREIVERKMGQKLQSTKDAQSHPDVPRSVPLDIGSMGAAQGALIGLPLYMGAVASMIGVASGGAALGTIATAGAIGGVIGAVVGLGLAGWFRGRHARRIKDQIQRGGLLLWVHIRDQKHEDRAREILARHPAQDMRVQEVAA